MGYALIYEIKPQNVMQRAQQIEPGLIPRFSLILCTVNRKHEVDKFLESLAKQSFKKFEVIIIDQNDGEFLDSTVAKWSSRLRIKHIKVLFRGLSRARNYGLSFANGDLIAFPDDDCEYQPSTLEAVEIFFRQNATASIVIGKQISKINSKKNSSPIQCRQIKNVLDIFLSKGISFTIFGKSNEIRSLEPGVFDEELGVGAGTEWGSGEETDFLIRGYRAGMTVFKNQAIMIFHPEKISSPKKCLHYGLGRYKVIAKNELGLIMYFFNLLQPIARLFLRNEYQFLLSHLCTVLGRSGLPLLFRNCRVR